MILVGPFLAGVAQRREKRFLGYASLHNLQALVVLFRF